VHTTGSRNRRGRRTRACSTGRDPDLRRARRGDGSCLSRGKSWRWAEARNLIIVRSADAVIAVGGEYGTLSEIAFALKLGVPVVGLGTWELSKDGRRVEAIVRATSPTEAVERALTLGAG